MVEEKVLTVALRKAHSLLQSNVSFLEKVDGLSRVQEFWYQSLVHNCRDSVGLHGSYIAYYQEQMNDMVD